jgi:hypothetical protein
MLLVARTFVSGPSSRGSGSLRECGDVERVSSVVRTEGEERNDAEREKGRTHNSLRSSNSRELHTEETTLASPASTSPPPPKVPKSIEVGMVSPEVLELLLG